MEANYNIYFKRGNTIEKADYGGAPIAYTKQVGLLDDISKRQSSYTSAIKLPRTAKNAQIMGYLGEVGNDSSAPYTTLRVDIYAGFLPIVKDGFVFVEKTTPEAYEISVSDGNIDLSKAIGDLKLYDLSLPELTHDVTLDFMKNQLSTTPSPFDTYRYIFADFGGKTIMPSEGEYINKSHAGYLNINALMPFVRLGYLWEKAFAHFGFAYEGSIFEDTFFKSLYLSMGDGKADFNVILNQDVEHIAGNHYQKPDESVEVEYRLNILNLFDTSDIEFIKLNWIKAKRKVGYSFRYKDEKIQFVLPDGSRKTGTFSTPNLNIGQTYEIPPIRITYKNEEEANKNDVISLGIIIITVNTLPLLAHVDEKEYALTLPIKDFFFEIFRNFGLTFQKRVDKDNTYQFYTTKEIIEKPPFDWTKKYIGKTSETYKLGDFAKKNLFKFKHYNDKDTYLDGSLDLINNANRPEEKTTFSSKTFAPRATDSIVAGIRCPYIELLKKDGDKIFDFENYSSAGDNRFHIITYEFIPMGRMRMSDNKIIGYGYNSGWEHGYNNIITGVTSVAKAVDYQRDYIEPYYSALRDKILNRMKVVTIDLNLNALDVYTLDFSRSYYFAQEGGRFILNKVQNFIAGKPTRCEFIAIND